MGKGLIRHYLKESDYTAVKCEKSPHGWFFETVYLDLELDILFPAKKDWSPLCIRIGWFLIGCSVFLVFV